MENPQALFRPGNLSLAKYKISYYLYAANKERPQAEQKCRLVSPPHGESGHIDWTAPVSGPVFYALTAVDRQGNESEPVYAEVR